MLIDKVGDYKEAFNFGPFIRGRAQQPIPDSVSQYEIRFNDFADSCHALCRKILYLLGLGLGVGDFFSSAHIIPEELMESSHSILRFLRYPPPSSTPHSSDDVRAGAHSDYGSVTLLFRLKGQAGLEILKKDNTWAPVPVCPAGTENDPSPPILINIGDLLSYWTNGLFRSTVHRVCDRQCLILLACDQCCLPTLAPSCGLSFTRSCLQMTSLPDEFGNRLVRIDWTIWVAHAKS